MLTNIIDLFENNALKKYPDKIAYKDVNYEVTFNDIYDKSRCIASYILDTKNIKNKPIIVLLEKGVYNLLVFHGITYSGNIYVPIDVTQPKERIKNIISVLNPELAVVNENTKEKIIDILDKDKIIYIDDCLSHYIDENKLLNVKQNIISTDPLYIIFTSGSTGVSKGVVINHQSVIDYIIWVEETYKINEMDIIGNQAPFYFDNSVLDIYTTLYTGCMLYLMQEKNFAFPAKILKEIEENRVTSIFWVASVLITIANSMLLEKYEYKGLNKILFAGEVMPNKQLNIWRKNLPNALYSNLYGPTEITVDCLYYIVDREFSDEELLPIGIPCNNTDVIILNQDNQEVKGNEIGEICVRGASLSMGYYNIPEKTAEVFVQNPLNPHYNELIYRTGDLGYYNEYKEVIYVGRKDFQIKHNGYRIELGEIETAAMAISEINNVCVLYNNKEKEITLFYTSKNELNSKYIREKLLNKISKYALPAKVYYLKEMPLTPNGKIDRQLLKKEYIGD